MNISVQISLQDLFSIIWNIYPEVELLDQMVILFYLFCYGTSQNTSFITTSISHYLKWKEINSALLFHMMAYKYVYSIDTKI